MTNERRIRREVARPYMVASHSKPRLNWRKNQVSGQEIRSIRVGLACSACDSAWVFSSRAASAGDRVSDTKHEIAVEAAMVMANCL